MQIVLSVLAIVALGLVMFLAYKVGWQDGHRQGTAEVGRMLEDMKQDLVEARGDVEELRKAAYGLNVENVRRDLGDD